MVMVTIDAPVHVLRRREPVHHLHRRLGRRRLVAVDVVGQPRNGRVFRDELDLVAGSAYALDRHFIVKAGDDDLPIADLLRLVNGQQVNPRRYILDMDVIPD